MNPSVIEEVVQKYYREARTVEYVASVRAPTEEKAGRIARSFRGTFPQVYGPRVTDYAKCVEVEAYIDELAPRSAEGGDALRRYIASTGRPHISLWAYLSWVGPYALVSLVRQEAPDGILAFTDAVASPEGAKLEESATREVTGHGFNVLSRSDLAKPVNIDARIVQEHDRIHVEEPVTLGKCLSYPWWTG